MNLNWGYLKSKFWWVPFALGLLVIWITNDVAINHVSIPTSLIRSALLFLVLGVLSLLWRIIVRPNHNLGSDFWKFLMPAVTVFLIGLVSLLIYRLLNLPV